MTAGKLPSGSTDSVCRDYGEPTRPGDRLVWVEYGKCTPYGMAPADTTDVADETDTPIHYYHEWCVPAGLAAAAGGDR